MKPRFPWGNLLLPYIRPSNWKIGNVQSGAFQQAVCGRNKSAKGKKNSDQASQCRSSFDEGLHSLGKDEVDRAKQQHARAPFFSPGRGKGPDQLATLVFGTGAGSEKRKQGFAADLGGCHSRSKGQAIPAEGRWMPSVSLLSREGTRSRDWVQMPCLGQLRRCRFMSHFAI